MRMLPIILRSDIAPVVHQTAPVQPMTQDLGIANADLQQVSALKSKIGGLRKEMQHARYLCKQL